MIKALILDADGVLIVNAEKFSKKFSAEYGVPIEKINSFFDGPFRECILGAADLKEVISPYLADWGWTEGAPVFLEYWFKEEHHLDESLIAYVKDLRTRGVRCFVASNQEKHRAEYMLEKMGFKDIFEKVYVSANLGHKKPSMEFYEKMYKDFPETQKDEIIFWDDTPGNVIAAKEFGIKAELYSSFQNFKHTMQNYFM